MHHDSLITLLTSHNACYDARAWAEGRLVDEAAYLACPRGDWLLWILTRLGLPRPQIVLAACACARTALRYVPAGEERPRRAIEVAEAWARGGEGAPTLEQVRTAADAARAADDADACAASAASAATYATYAASDADACAVCAASAASAATYATYAASTANATAYDAAYATAYDAAYATAYAAAYAARAAYAAYAAAAHAAAAAAYAAADYAAHTKALAECADIVRGIIPWEAVEPLLARRT